LSGLVVPELFGFVSRRGGAATNEEVIAEPEDAEHFREF
jgi:hypothetical protein